MKCEQCGKSIEPISEKERKQLLKKGLRFSSYYFVIQLRVSEMDVRGLGSAGESEFCSWKCLKDWIKKNAL
jgi:hypothetical protein